jgi:hypothetical protein
MKRIATTILFSLLSVTVYADGNYGCVMNVSGGLKWVNGSWKLTNFKPENILISVKENGSKLKYKSNSFEGEYDCSTENLLTVKTKFLNCHDYFGSVVVFDEVTLKGGSSFLFGSISKSNDRDSLSVNEFTCQKF